MKTKMLFALVLAQSIAANAQDSRSNCIQTGNSISCNTNNNRAPNYDFIANPRTNSFGPGDAQQLMIQQQQPRLMQQQQQI
jgi:hypothetical protein